MFKKGDIVEYIPSPGLYGIGTVLRDQYSEIVHVNFSHLQYNEYRAFSYNLRLVSKKVDIKLNDELFDI